MYGMIGAADEFYRLRVTRLDEGDAPDLDWRDDILYRAQVPEQTDEYDVWRVEVVGVENEDEVIVLKTFSSESDAREWLEPIALDLAELTKSQFEKTYFDEEPEDLGAPEG